MSKSIKGYFLGRPHASIEAWINGQPIPPVPPADQFSFLYKLADGTEWQVYEPAVDDIQQDAAGNVYITATSFKAQSWFGDVREVMLPSKWNNGSEDVDITSIGASAFYPCSGLTDITIPDSITSIGPYAFRDCTGLTSVIIPNSVVSIGYCAFMNCTGLMSVTIPNDITNIEEGVFDGTPFYDNLPDGLVIFGRVAYEMKGPCPASVEIPNGIVSIGNWAFDSRDSLTNVTIPNSVTNIGREAFNSCGGLTSVTIPDSVTSIGEGVFAWSGLTSVTIGAGVTGISDSAFLGCAELTGVTFPNSVTSIGNNAFQECYALKSVTIPDSVRSIGDGVFVNCIGLTTTEFKGRSLAQVKAIPDADGNLQYPWGLTESIIVPGKVEDVVLYTTAENPSTWLEGMPIFDISTSSGIFSGFAEKANAVKVIIPSKVNNVVVTSIGYKAFSGCTKLASVTIPISVTNIDRYAFYGCYMLTNVTIPDGVTSIGSYAFADCCRLTSVTIPNNIKSIEELMFRSCSDLTSVTLGNSVVNIGKQAFLNCSKLMSIEFKGNAPAAVGDYAFEGIASGCKALISSTATGFNVDSQGKWNGLIVEVKS